MVGRGRAPLQAPGPSAAPEADDIAAEAEVGPGPLRRALVGLLLGGALGALGVVTVPQRPRGARP